MLRWNGAYIYNILEIFLGLFHGSSNTSLLSISYTAHEYDTSLDHFQEKLI